MEIHYAGAFRERPNLVMDPLRRTRPAPQGAPSQNGLASGTIASRARALGRGWLILVIVGLWVLGLTASLYLTPHRYVVAELFGVPMVLAAYHASARVAAVVCVGSGLLAIGAAVLDQVPFQVWGFSAAALAMLGLLSVTAARERLRALAGTKEAQLARRQIEQFTEAISYRMRDPLLVVLARTHLVAVDNPEQQDNVRAIDEAAESLRRFSDDIIDAASIGAGQFHVEPSPFNGSHAAQNVVAEFRRRRPKLALELHTEGTLDVWWDKRRIEQLLSKLIDQASRRAPAGMVDIGLRDEGEKVRITVQGVESVRPLEQYPSRSMLAPVCGTDSPGLVQEREAAVDLYLCQAIVEAHGGRMWLDASNGQICTFDVDMPKNLRPPARNDRLSVRPEF